MRRLSLAATVLSLCLITAIAWTSFAQTNRPERIFDLLQGTWKQNQAKSKQSPTSAQLAFRRSEKGTLEELRASNTGKPFPEPVIFDGKPHMLADGVELTWKQSDASTFERVSAIKGQVLNIRKIQISTDGKTLTEEIQAKMTDGKTSVSKRIYQRNGGEAQGLVGTWAGRSLQPGDPAEVKYERVGNNALKATSRDGRVYTLTLDGKPATVSGGGVLPNTTISAKQIDAHTFESTMSREGSAFVTFKTVISEDGKTLRLTSIPLRPNAKGEPSITVLEKQ
jgi:hypothetical protein